VLESEIFRGSDLSGNWGEDGPDGLNSRLRRCVEGIASFYYDLTAATSEAPINYWEIVIWDVLLRLRIVPDCGQKGMFSG
jgi:hypothetical protein